MHYERKRKKKVCVRDQVERRRGHYGRSGSIFGYPRRRLPLSPRTPSVPPLPLPLTLTPPLEC